MSDPSESVTIDRESLRMCVRQAIDELNEQLSPEQRVENCPDAKLFGLGAPLDSLGLVNLIVEVEEQLADELDVEVTLANEKAMSRRASPFQSVDSLLDFVEELIREADGE
jgi:acyl carrier protein